MSCLIAILRGALSDPVSRDYAVVKINRYTGLRQYTGRAKSLLPSEAQPIPPFHPDGEKGPLEAPPETKTMPDMRFHFLPHYIWRFKLQCPVAVTLVVRTPPPKK